MAAMIALALPAAALTGSGSSGSGTLFTDLNFESHPEPSCASAKNGFGATTTFSSATLGSYSGSLTINWTVNQTNGPWYEGPDGTYGNANGACANGHYGESWAINGTVTGSTVSCTGLTGTYSRTNDVDVAVSLTGTCTGGGTPTGTTFTLTTTLGTCVDEEDPPFIPESCATTDSFTAAN